MAWRKMSMPAWKKKARGRKMFARRKGGLRRRGIRQPVQFFKRSVYVQAYHATSTGGPAFITQTFKLSDVPNAAEFTGLYDQYQIKGVKITLIPRCSESDTTQNAANQIFSAIDYDSSAAPASIDELTQYQNCRMTRNLQMHKRYLKPKALVQVYTPAATAYANAPPVTWIDCSSPSVPHYGVKYAFPSGLVAFTYDAKIDYYLALKNVR